ncbi:MAG: 30S ribosomal protein S13 [Candidatus Lokiarchaeota archaeon]|nr:30S ribosomal protein S13 [Candidatus Lokiarchaeota archaeon]
MSLSPIRPPNFKEQIFFRKLRARVDGNAKVEYALSQIKGIGRRFAQIVVKKASINPLARLGALSEKEILLIEEIVSDPLKYGIPSYLLNRQKDIVHGNDRHVIGNHLEITVKRDIDRMKRMKSYRGIRHHFGLKVRGQRTKSTGRHGLVIGFQKKAFLKKLKGKSK